MIGHQACYGNTDLVSCLGFSIFIAFCDILGAIVLPGGCLGERTVISRIDRGSIPTYQTVYCFCRAGSPEHAVIFCSGVWVFRWQIG